MWNTAKSCLYGREKRSAVLIFLTVIEIICIVVLFVMLMLNLFFTSIYVDGDSMSPTLTGASEENPNGGDYVIAATKMTPDYQDIVIVRDQSEGINLIKRVIAFGGDAVKFKEGRAFLKRKGEEVFTPLDEPYLHVIEYPDRDKNNYGEHVVAEGCMFLVGDNRDASLDSRNAAKGDFPMSSLVGVVPKWSIQYKEAITGFYGFFRFSRA